MENSFYIADLFVKKIKGIISPEELQELEQWINKSPENLTIYTKATDRKNQLSKLEVYNLFRKDKMWSTLEKELFNTRTIKLIPQKFLKYAAAIFIPLLITGSIAYYFLNITSETNLAELDLLIKPGTQRAMLVLSNGGTIELDADKLIPDIHEGDVYISNKNKSLKYSDEEINPKTQELIYNELKTPNGGGYNLQLADGSKVWLNAGSSLKFPVSFTDSTRQVFLEGEAYFEVSHNGKPFIVSSGNMDIRVLGTSFNVSAYKDEQHIKTTLVEGKVSIKITDDDELSIANIVLTPNKQAVLNRLDSKISVSEVNTTQYTSWMKGKLEFNNETLEIVMKRLARWYDFEYEFENNKAKEFHFTARMNNNESISSILHMLEMTTDVKFEIKESTIVVI